MQFVTFTERQTDKRHYDMMTTDDHTAWRYTIFNVGGKF